MLVRQSPSERMGRLLASLESTQQKPLRRACERDPEAVAQWVRKDDPQLRRRARTVGATIFFLDEAGFSSEPALGRTDGLRGQTPVVATSGQRQKVSARSARSARGGFWTVKTTTPPCVACFLNADLQAIGQKTKGIEHTRFTDAVFPDDHRHRAEWGFVLEIPELAELHVAQCAVVTNSESFDF